MTSLRIEGGRPLRGQVRVPGDKSISHRALILAALAEGVSVVRGLSPGADVAGTAAAVRAVGAIVDGHLVTGGRSRLHEPAGVVDVGNSGTTIRLLAGLCAGFDWLTVLAGDASIARRPMDRVADPLRRMGARVDGRDGGRLPPLTIRGGGLQGIDYDMPVASAQVKSAILLAGLSADGETVVREPTPTRAHTEEMLDAAGADVEVADGGHTIRLRPSDLHPFELDVPGDPSQAAFWVVAACIVPGSELTIDDVYLGPGRAGFLDVLAAMGADVERVGERSLRARHSPDLHGTDVEGDQIPGLIDEIPVLAVAAAMAEGKTTFQGAGELRVKESDRVATITSELSALGVKVEATDDGLTVEGTGGSGLQGGPVRSHGDHRVAMAMAVAAMAAAGETVIDGWGRGRHQLPRLRGRSPPMRVPMRVPVRVIAIDGPVGSGKSTVARAVADRLGLDCLETGAMYRAVAAAVLRRGDDGADPAAVARSVEIEMTDGRVVVDGEDVTDEIRRPEVGRTVSKVAAVPEVRTAMVSLQRRWVADHGGAVVEGRDIGSVVFPDAELKVFLTATPEERAKRRSDEDADDVRRRDRIDSTRAVSPLVVPDGAVVIDSTGRSVDDVVDQIVGLLR